MGWFEMGWCCKVEHGTDPTLKKRGSMERRRLSGESIITTVGRESSESRREFSIGIHAVRNSYISLPSTTEFKKLDSTEPQSTVDQNQGSRLSDKCFESRDSRQSDNSSVLEDDAFEDLDSSKVERQRGARQSKWSTNVISDLASHLSERTSAIPGNVAEDGKTGDSNAKSPEESDADSPETPPAAIPHHRRMSHDTYWHPGQTVIIFDWDDTLFPTTWVRHDMRLAWNKPCPKNAKYLKPLDLCATHVIETLKLARRLSDHVVIVTLARKPWVATSCQNFMPRMMQVLDELNIPVVYAQEVTGKGATEYDKEKFSKYDAEAAHWTHVKGTAITAVCDKCYSQYPGQSWKNVLSIGDSDFERNATREAIQSWCQANQKTAYQLPRTKTLKMLDAPQTEQLVDQLKLICHWLPSLVQRDQGFNIDLDLAGTENMGGIEELISGLEGYRGDDQETPDKAMYEGRPWKLSVGGNPLEEDDWVRRRMWISKTGYLWYESLKEGKPAQYFPGIHVGSLNAGKAEPEMVVKTIGGAAIFAFWLEVPKRVLVNVGRKTDAGLRNADVRRKTYLGVTTEHQRQEWFARLESLKQMYQNNLFKLS